MLRWWCWRPGPVERDAGAGVRPLGAGGSIHEVPPAVGGSRWEGGCAQWQKKRPARDRCAVEQRRSRSGRICVCPHVRVLESNRNEQKGERRRKKTREIVAGGGRLPAAVPPKARERYRQSRKLLRWLLGSLCSQTQTHTHTHTKSSDGAQSRGSGRMSVLSLLPSPRHVTHFDSRFVNVGTHTPNPQARTSSDRLSPFAIASCPFTAVMLSGRFKTYFYQRSRAPRHCASVAELDAMASRPLTNACTMLHASALRPIVWCL